MDNNEELRQISSRLQVPSKLWRASSKKTLLHSRGFRQTADGKPDIILEDKIRIVESGEAGRITVDLWESAADANIPNQ